MAKSKKTTTTNPNTETQENTEVILDQNSLTAQNGTAYNDEFESGTTGVSTLDTKTAEGGRATEGSEHMGRKKIFHTEQTPVHAAQPAQPAPSTATKSTGDGEELSNTEMVRRAVNYLGQHCSATDVINYVKQTWEVELKESTAQNYTSQVKRELRGDTGSAATGRAAKRRGPEDSTEPSVTDLITVKDVADETDGGVESLVEQLTQLETIASRVGGFGKLRKTLDALTRLTESKK